jgi:hypothetical protein
MPNRFTQSIKQLEAAAESKPPINEPAASQQEDTPLPFTGNMSQPQAAAITNGAVNDLLGEIPITKRQGKHITVYLTNEVIGAVTKIEKQRGVSRSKVVDKALRQVLKVG